MTEIYADFGIEIYDSTIKNETIELMKKLGEIQIKETKLKTTIISFTSFSKNTPYIEDVSKELCAIIFPYREEFREFFIKFRGRIYSDICFVVNVDDDGISIRIDKELISICSYLGLEIQIDGL